MANDRELDIVAKTLWGEARGEGWRGLIAVAWVIRNRAERPGWWGNSPETVCLKAKQFSCWNKGDPNYPYLAGFKAIPGREYAECREAAVAVLGGLTGDTTGGATHYHARALRNPPPWTNGAKRSATIGNHVFYREVP